MQNAEASELDRLQAQHGLDDAARAALGHHAVLCPDMALVQGRAGRIDRAAGRNSLVLPHGRNVTRC